MDSHTESRASSTVSALLVFQMFIFQNITKASSHQLYPRVDESESLTFDEKRHGSRIDYFQGLSAADGIESGGFAMTEWRSGDFRLKGGCSARPRCVSLSTRTVPNKSKDKPIGFDVLWCDMIMVWLRQARPRVRVGPSQMDSGRSRRDIWAVERSIYRCSSARLRRAT